MTFFVSPPYTLPNPLRSGDWEMLGGSFLGDVGSIDKSSPIVLRLANNARVLASVGGFGDPSSNSSYAHYAYFEIIGTDYLEFSHIGGGRTPIGPGFVTVSLDPGATLLDEADSDAGLVSFTTSTDGFITYNGGSGSKLQNFGGVSNGGGVTVNADIVGNGVIQMNVAYPTYGGDVTLNGSVDGDETIYVGAGVLTIGQTLLFNGVINWISGPDPDQTVKLGGIHADAYRWDGVSLHLLSHGIDVKDIRGSLGASIANNIYDTASGVEITKPNPSTQGIHLINAVSNQLPTSPRFLLNDVSTGAQSYVSGQDYSGPVGGVQAEYINGTSDNLNVVSLSDNVFIHTGSGTDAVDLSGHGGTNVVDAGSGSNFIVGSTAGKDTFFDNANGATSDIWNTIVNFHAGDASTLWGVTELDFNFAWSAGQGAVGREGLTLHATPKSGLGPEVSVTFAGQSGADLASLQIIEDTRSNYTYILQT